MCTVRPRLIALVGLAATLLGAPGCKSDGNSDPGRSTTAAAPASAPRARQTSGGSYYVTYTPLPSPIPLNKVFAMDVRVCRDEAMTVPADDAAAIVADAAMPHHHHGMNLVPRAERTGPGTFRVNGMLFHMPGYWEIYVDVKAGGKDERARFEVEIQ